MEYSIKQLALLSGVSTRTLRYYDEIGLLKPQRISSNNYRVYSTEQVDKLQQILLFRELEVSLNDIKRLVDSSEFDNQKALNSHLTKLKQKREHIEMLIDNVTKTISSLKGEFVMSDKEKFEAFKAKLVDDNEQEYGDEIRQSYGDEVVDQSNSRLKNMSQQQFEKANALSTQINATLKEAFLTGDPKGAQAMKACELHKQWLEIYWPKGVYSKETHMGLGEMYLQDERFKAYYDQIAEGCAEFLRDAINEYCKN